MQLQLQHSACRPFRWWLISPVCWAEDAAKCQGPHAVHSSSAAVKAQDSMSAFQSSTKSALAVAANVLHLGRQ